jgi:uncharacterized membrane protein
MNILARLGRHMVTTTAAGRRAFPVTTLKAIQAAIAKGEVLHRAEVRLIIEPALSPSVVLQRMSSRERARELFSHYRIWDTEEHCGVLIYVNLADRKVEIVSDRGVGRTLKAGDWQAVCKTMTQGFARGEFHESTIAGLSQLNDLLKVHFPAAGGKPNELPNRPIILS